MTQDFESFWGWPGWRHLRYACLLSLVGTLWFLLIYDGANALTALRTYRVRIHLDAELGIPLIPELIVVYWSIYLLFLAAPFVLRQRRELFAFSITLNLAILVGGFCFLLFPAGSAFASSGDLGVWAGMFRLTKQLNLDYNMVPSLHVALSTICIAVFAGRASRTGKVLLWTWAVAISVSTLLTHQHHILDVVTGFVLALAAFKFIYLRFDHERTMTFNRSA